MRPRATSLRDNSSARHPAAEFAREDDAGRLARTGIWLADGPTNIMPIRPTAGEGRRLANPIPIGGKSQGRACRMEAAFRKYPSRSRQRLLSRLGFASRAASRPLRGCLLVLPRKPGSASERMRNFIEKAAQATRVGQVFDDAAMAQGLLTYFLRAINCGAVTAEEAQSLTTLSLAELSPGRSFKSSQAAAQM